MSACDLCGGAWTVARDPDAPLSQVLGHVVDLGPCPRCLSVPATQVWRDILDGSQFYPWETPEGNYAATGSAWWDPEEQVPLYLPMGLDLGMRFLAKHYGDEHDGPWSWWDPRIFDTEPEQWALTRPSEDEVFGVIFWDLDKNKLRPVAPRQQVVGVPALATIPADLPKRVRRIAAAAVCIRHALGMEA